MRSTVTRVSIRDFEFDPPEDEGPVWETLAWDLPGVRRKDFRGSRRFIPDDPLPSLS